MTKIYTIESPARIHLGFMELDDKASRLFGSVGLAITGFKNKQQIQPYNKFEVICSDPDIKIKIMNAIQLFSKTFDIRKCKITVFDFIPLHQGLGSGTQISLCTGFLLSKFNKLKLSVDDISKFLKRGQRSGIGVETFKSGGVVIDLGKKKKSIYPPLKLISIKWPKDWQIILLTDKKFSGLFGEQEIKEFSKLQNIKNDFVKENSFNILMKVIPGLLEKDFDPFVNGIQSIQENMSKIFYGKKNHFFSTSISKIFNMLREKNYLGFGQSSWGPTSFIFCKNKIKRQKILNIIENFIELKKIEGINLINVNGRNFGNREIKVKK